MSARRKSRNTPEQMLQDARNMILKSYEQLGEAGGQKGSADATGLPPYEIVWEVIDRLRRALGIIEAIPLPDEPDLYEDEEDDDIFDYDYDYEEDEEDEEEEEEEEEEDIDEEQDEDVKKKDKKRKKG